MTVPWIIKDWAGNRIAPDREFDTFEGGWEYIDGPLTDDLELTETDYEDYFVIELEDD
jgi:hypothetical protein